MHTDLTNAAVHLSRYLIHVLQDSCPQNFEANQLVALNCSFLNFSRVRLHAGHMAILGFMTFLF